MAASTSAETVRVIVRCRPMNQREIDLKCQSVITMNIQARQVLLENFDQTNEPPKQFTFDAVYPEDSITETLYADSVFPLVENVLEGYNATVFAYGQTGCGKSFTMQGINTPGSAQRGVIPRSFEHIFEASSVASETKYLIRASYLEIYNETIRDLLGKDVKAALDLKEYADKGVQVQNLTWHQCISVTDCERLMDRGNKNRATGATLMNKDSSRSHSIFTIVTEMCSRSEIDGKEHIRAGKLNLVDLAGSERQSKTQAEGDRLREATRINLSLSALGNVISALVDGRSKHIPYRDSKLTRLLQDSLGGNTKTLMVAAISPAHDNYDETLSTLRYANRAKNIKNKPRINEDPRDAQMKLMQEEINRLKQELMNAGGAGGAVISRSITNGTFDDEQIEKEKERLKEEFERQASELRRQYEAERLTKEEIQRKYDQLQGKYQEDVNALGTSNRSSSRSAMRSRGKKKTTTTTTDQEMNDLATMDPEEKRRRLEELEKNFIGGEDANNEERKKKRKRKLLEMKEKQEQKKQMIKAIDNNDEDMMMRVFDNAQEELHFLSKKLEQERLETKRLKNDNEDLQYEFERDRQGYLNTIRSQEKQLLLFRTLLDKMSGLMQRNCNYSHIEKIIEQSRYDEERNEYIVPEIFIEEVQFPQVNHSSSSTRAGATNSSSSSFYPAARAPIAMTTDYQNHMDRPLPIPMTPVNGYHNSITSMSEDEIQMRYGRGPELPLGPTISSRQGHLLRESVQSQKRISALKPNNSENDYMNRRLNPYETPSRLGQKYGFSTDKP